MSRLLPLMRWWAVDPSDPAFDALEETLVGRGFAADLDDLYGVLGSATVGEVAAIERAVIDAFAADGGWRRFPDLWVRERLGEWPWSAQAEVLRALATYRKVAVHSGHGVGKSFVASRAVLWWLSNFDDALALSTAPTGAQVRSILWREIRAGHRKGRLPGRTNQVEWINSAGDIIGMGRKPSDTDEHAFQGLHCLSEDHEILTRRGWLGVDDVGLHDSVLSVPINGDTAEWMPVTDRYEYPFDGELNVYDGQSVSFAVTDNHRFPTKYDKRNPGGWRLKPLSEMRSQFVVRRTSGWEGEPFEVPAPFARYGWDMERFARFVGFWIGDGGLRTHHATGRLYEVILYQKKTDGMPFVADLLDGLATFEGRDYVAFSDKECAAWLEEHVGRYQVDRRMPDFLRNAPTYVLNALCDGLWASDGTTATNGERRGFYNSSRRLMDDVQEVLVKLGCAGTIGLNRCAGSVCSSPNGLVTSKSDVWVLGWVNSPTDHRVLTANIRREPYKGRVWCISTPHQTFYTRRNGRVSLTGNSERALVVLDEAGGVPETLFEDAEKIVTTPGSRILAVGNPTHEGTYWHKVCSGKVPDWHVIHVSALLTPNFTDEREKTPGDVLRRVTSELWVDEQRRRYGEGSVRFRQQVLGQFTKERAMTVVPVEWATRAASGEVVSTGEGVVRLGVDVGATGDWFVIRAMAGNRVGKLWRDVSGKAGEQASLVVSAAYEVGATEVVIDSAGVGYGLPDLIRERNPALIVVPVDAAEKSSVVRLPDGRTVYRWAIPSGIKPEQVREVFLNRRAELWWAARERCQLVVDPTFRPIVPYVTAPWDLSALDDPARTDVWLGLGEDDPTLDELCAPGFEDRPRAQGTVIQIESKDELRKATRLGRSSDHADSLILASFPHPGREVLPIKASSAQRRARRPDFKPGSYRPARR